MRRSTPKLVNHLIEKTNSLQTLQLQAIRLLNLDRALKALLPKPLQAVCRLSNYRHQRLIIQVNNATWLNRLRYEQETLTAALRQSDLPELSGIDFVINPGLNSLTTTETQPNQATINQRKLTARSSALIVNLAGNCKDGLKQALTRLAQHAKKTNNDIQQ